MLHSNKRLGHRGFTVPELVVAVVVILVMLLASTMLLRPQTYDLESRNAERRLALIEIVKALERYKASTGKYPERLPGKPIAIGSADGMFDLCSLLVPTYIDDIPIDPVTGSKADFVTSQDSDEPCNEPGIDYVSGYAVNINTNGTITVGLELPEDRMISLTSTN